MLLANYFGPALNTYLVIIILSKICIWALSFTLYFNLISILLIVSLVFSLSVLYQFSLYCYFLDENCRYGCFIVDVANSQNKKLFFIDVAIN